jgi:hypothetical protein
MGATASADAGPTEIRPFTIDVTEEQPTDLPGRVAATPQVVAAEARATSRSPR